MKLWLVSQDVNNSFDTYDSAVVVAATSEEARAVKVGDVGKYGSWALPEHVTAEYIGEACEGLPAGKIICASYNAG